MILDKMRDWFELWPKETRDRLALTTVLVVAPLVILFECTVIAPQFVAVPSTEFWLHLTFTSLICFNFYGNLYKLMTVDASGRNSDLPSVLKAGWRYCYQCQLNAPPRAYHCPSCSMCVLKRDHHCAFAATCVGYHNHRHYVVAAIYAWLGCAYVLWWHWDYIWNEMGGISLWTVWTVVMPHIALITRCISLWQFIVAGIQMSSVACFLIATYLVISQLILIMRGQTMHEFLLGIRSYDLGVSPNLSEVFGSRPILALLVPFASSPLSGDGLSFPIKLNQNTKDM